MNVREFSGKYSVVLLFSTVVLFVMVVTLGVLSFGRMGSGPGRNAEGIGNRPKTTENGKNIQKGDMQKNRAGGQTRATVDFQAPTNSGTLAQ